MSTAERYDQFLLGCPFCGCRAMIQYHRLLHLIGMVRWRVLCSQCGAEAPTGWRPTRDGATFAWNRRAPQATQPPDEALFKATAFKPFRRNA